MTAPALTPAPTDIAGSAVGRLDVRDIHKAFAGTRALAGVSLEVARGTTVGLIGPNGSGKTTLVNIIAGGVAPDAGSVTVDGIDLARKPAAWRARHGVSRTFQNVRLFRELTVAENCEVALVALPRRVRRARPGALGEVLEILGLVDVADREAGTLAYGLQRRVELARAAVIGPRFLLLDEPAAGMNPTETAALVQAIRTLREELACGVLVVEHDLGFVAELCDVVAVLDAGVAISRGPLDDVRRDPAVVEAYIGRESTSSPGSEIQRQREGER